MNQTPMTCPDCGGEMTMIGANREGWLVECDQCYRRDIITERTIQYGAAT